MTPAWFAFVGWVLAAFFFAGFVLERRARRDADGAIVVYRGILNHLELVLRVEPFTPLAHFAALIGRGRRQP